ncbi:hypothetical protein N657DRAFT_202462 [Parathielavia appendiculata]|uniref:Secreted protein n=1 Tax=Parathielavia appendiculata TaxID=2587402 RepID=A0AAN6U6A5_9PEZI|nr:hypothetical protein N657DRAFT_202462 [Parathielavia appendiculata]
MLTRLLWRLRFALIPTVRCGVTDKSFNLESMASHLHHSQHCIKLRGCRARGPPTKAAVLCCAGEQASPICLNYVL